MAAFGIEYRPQFIQSDIGAMQKKFDDLQQAYDQSYMGTLSAEDQYNQLEVNPVDIALKNEIIQGFRDRTQAIVDKYGGDWGAAAKQLAREVVKTKQDPFFQLASRRNQLAEEQRKLKQQYGPDAIVLKDISKTQLRDKEGKYISPDELGYEVLHRGQFKEMMNRELGHLAKDVREGQFRVSKNTPWQMERDIITGITEDEVIGVAQQGYALLKKQRPDLPDDIAFDIAMNEARSYVGDKRTDFTANKPWDIQQQKNMYLWQRSQEAPPPPAPDEGLPFSSSGGPGRINKNVHIERINKELEEFKAAAADYYNPKKKRGDLVNSTTSELQRRYTTDSKYVIGSGAVGAGTGAPQSKETVESRYKKALGKLKENPTYNTLIKKGMGPVQAASYAYNEMAKKYQIHDRYDAPRDLGITQAIWDDIRRNSGKYTGAVDMESGEKMSARKFKDVLVEGTDPLIEFNGARGTIKLTVNQKGTVRHYELPMSNVQNNEAYVASNKYKDFVNSIYGGMPETPKNAPKTLSFKGKGFTYESQYNPATKTIDKQLVFERVDERTGRKVATFFSTNPSLIQSGQALPFEYGMDALATFGTSAISDLYGGYTIYTDNKRDTTPKRGK